MTKRQIIIDTDPGLDDAVGILFALNSGRFSVLGLTSVAGNLGIDVTTRNCGRLLALLDRAEVPVVAGATAPLTRQGIDEVAIHGNDGLGGVVLPEPLVPAIAGFAPDWMADQLLAHPAGSIDILALGPLTNIALLVRDHPEAAQRLGRVIIMGGVVNDRGNVGPHSEFNFACDPEAVDAVLRAGLEIVIIPLDVTRQVRADEAYLEGLRGGSTSAKAAAELILAYFKDGRESRPLHDPCVMLYALEPALFTLETLCLSIDLGAGEDAGAFRADEWGVPISIALGVNARGALALLASGLV